MTLEKLAVGSTSTLNTRVTFYMLWDVQSITWTDMFYFFSFHKNHFLCAPAMSVRRKSIFHLCLNHPTFTKKFKENPPDVTSYKKTPSPADSNKIFTIDTCSCVCFYWPCLQIHGPATTCSAPAGGNVPWPFQHLWTLKYFQRSPSIGVLKVITEFVIKIYQRSGGNVLPLHSRLPVVLGIAQHSFCIAAKDRVLVWLSPNTCLSPRLWERDIPGQDLSQASFSSSF